jgi:hypothetical protein
MYFSWEDLYMENKVPQKVFMNFQLHLGDGRYLDYVADGYIACLGGLRYACRLTNEEKAALGTDNAMALHIFNLNDGKDPGETDAPTETTEEVTEAPETEPETEAPTAAPETEAPETEAPTDAPATEAPETEPAKSGCGSVTLSAAAVLIAAAAMYGLCYSLGTVSTAMLTREMFGADKYSRVYPKLAMTTTLSNAIFTTVVGMLYDMSGTYTTVILFLAVLVAVAFAMVQLAYMKKAKMAAAA